MNRLHTTFLIVAMACILSLLGYLLAGPGGAKLALIIAVISFALTPALPHSFVMARMGARPVHPVQAPGLYRIVAQLAEKAGLQRVPALYLLPVRQLNAFAMGNAEHSAIGITQGLLSAINTREMAGILAHEITHIQNNDTRVMALSAVFSRLTGAISLGGQILLILGFPLVLAGIINISIPLLLALAFAPWLSLILFQALSRSREFEADLGSARLLNDPAPLASALSKLAAYHAAARPFFFSYPGKRPDPLLQSHPDTRERIRRLLELAHPCDLSLRTPCFPRFR